ncbi:MAG TPA: glycosyltransferase [Cellulomonadaceae bacterium]|nr:glycosyltransferase [Cellulomonadaceae bacterium]
MPAPLLQSFFLGGFESSTMRRRDGRRNDLVAATRHDEFARQDYGRVLAVGTSTVREGTAWHLIEARRGHFDPESVIGRVRAAESLGIQLIWDLCHFGWPDDIDPFASDFADRLARFAAWFARLLRDESSSIPWYVPLNEPSFVAWGAADVGYLNPFQRGRGSELKRQLVRASLAAAAAVREVDPRARICHVDPVIHIEQQPDAVESRIATFRHNDAQFEAWDMLAGRQDDDLGGSEAELDVIGVSFYDRNQWVDGGPTLRIGEPGFRPLHDLLADVYHRYRRPIVVAETGSEGAGRAPWFRYVCDEVATARANGVAVEGVCLYPVVDHPGWDDDRQVPVGMWGYPDDAGNRPPYQPLIDEVRRQASRFPRSASPASWQEGASSGKTRDADAGAVRPGRTGVSAGAGGDRRGAIVLVTDSRRPSGMGRQMVTLARGLAARHRVIIAAPDAVDARWLLRAARDAGLESWALTDGSPQAQAEMLHGLLAEAQIDLVNIHAGIGWEGHAAIAAARGAGVKTVVRTEHLPFLLTKAREQVEYYASLARLDRLITVSHGVGRSHVMAGVPKRLIRAVPNGVDDPGIPTSRAAVRQAVGIDTTAPLVVSVGRLTAQKGYDVLLAAAAAVVGVRSETRFVIVGSGPLESELDAAIAELRLERNVRRLPHWDDVPALLAAADVVALASRFEGLPLVALEAMAVARPVIGTRVCGLEETIEDGVTGRLVAPGDVAALGAAILELLGDPATAARYGRAGRSRYEASFTAQRMVDETDAVYTELLHERARPDRADQVPPDASLTAVPGGAR